MKTKIIERLKTTYSKFGFGQAAFDAVGDYLAKSVTEEAQIDQAVGGVEQLLKIFQSEADKLRSEKAASAKELEELKAKQAAGGEPAPKTEPEPKEDDKTPEWAKALLESNQKLTERLNTIEGEKVTSTRRTQLDAILEKLPEQLRKPYARMDIKSLSDEAFTELTNEVTAEVDGIIENSAKEGLAFSVPAGSKGNGGKGDDIDSLVGSIEKGTKEQVEQLKTGK